MPDIVQGVDPSTIATVIEASINAYLLSFACLPGAISHEGPEVVWIDSGMADATFNSVVYASFEPETADALIESVLSHFRRRSRPVTWHVGPSTRPSDLGRFLLAHGLTHSEDEPGMAIEIGHMRDDVPAAPDLTLETVRDEQSLEDWISVWLFPLSDEDRRPYLDALRLRGLGDDLPWRYYLGRVNGKPVATAELFTGEGVAGVQYVVTVPEVRRRGIGTAMTVHALREARAMGYRVGVLTASPDGIGIYRRIGFREYCWFRRYEWT
jgi:GNAT superfamily N-acetyltransferase